ncbi:MAG: hypothetical protein ACLRFG_01955, partial [Clostridia bacterium]
TDLTTHTLTDNFMELDNLTAGDYNFMVRVKKDSQNSLVSEWSTPFTATKLNTPALTILDGKIKLTGVTGATGYNLIINGRVVNIGNATTYTLGVAYTAGEYTIGAQSYSSFNAIISSNMTADDHRLVVDKLATPDHIDMTDGVVTFSGNNSGATYNLYLDGELIDSTSAEEYEFADGEFADAKTYNLTIQAVKNGSITADITPAYAIIRLKAPDDVILAGDQFEIDAVESTEGYWVEFINLTDSTKTILEEVPAKTWMDVPGMEEGDYQVVTRATGNGKNILNSQAFTLTGVSVLPTPTWNDYADDTLSFGAVDGAHLYNLTITNATIDKETDSITTTLTLGSIPFWSDLTAGEYIIKVRAIGNNEEVLSSKFTEDDNAIHIIKLAIPSALTYDQDTNILNWEAVDNATSYAVYKGAQLLTTTTTNSLALDSFVGAGNYTFSVKAVGGNYISASKTGYANSERCAPISIHKTASALGFALDGNRLVWKKVAGTDYTINIAGGESITFVPSADNEFAGASRTMYRYDLVTGLWEANEHFDVAGEYKVSLTAINSASTADYTLPSELTTTLTINKLEPVAEISMTDRLLNWRINPLASGYYVVIDNARYITAPVNNAMANGDYLTLDLNTYLDAGEHVVNVVAKGDGRTYFDSNMSAQAVVEKLGVASLSFSGSTLSWGAVDNADYYTLTINYTNGGALTEVVTTTAQSFNINTDADKVLADISGVINFNIVAHSFEDSIIHSDNSARLTVNRFSAPQLIVLYGRLTWASVDNAREYELIVGGETIAEYSQLSNYGFNGKPAGAYDVQIIAKNKAQSSGVAGDTIYADGVIGEMTVTKLNAPTGFGVQDGKFKFSAVENAETYYIYIGAGYYSFSPIEPQGIYQDLTLYSIVAGRNDDSYVTALADGYITSEPSDSITVRMLSQPQNLSILDNVISWSSVTDAITYAVTITNVLDGSVIKTQTFTTNDTKINLPTSMGWIEGEYHISVQAFGGQITDANGTVYLTISQPSSELLVVKQKTVTGLKSMGGEISWNSIPTATKYNLIIEDGTGAQTNASTTGTECTFDMVNAGFSAGYYKIKVQAVGNNERVLDSFYCEPREFVLLPAVAVDDIALNKGNITFKAPSIFSYAKFIFTNASNASIKYEFDYSADKFNTLGQTQLNFANMVNMYGENYATWDYTQVFASLMMTYTYDLPISIPEGEYKFTIKLLGNSFDGTTEITIDSISLLSGAVSAAKDVEKLQTPDIAVAGGVISWSNKNAYTDMNTYRVTINNITFETDKFNEIDFNKTYLDVNVNGQYDSDTDIAFEAKLYQVSVVLVGDDTIYLSSNSSDTEDVRILAEPTMTQSLGTLTWTAITYAEGYRLELVEYPQGYTDDTIIDLGQNITSYHFRAGNYPAGDYKIKIYALGNGEDVLISKSQTIYNKTKLDIEEANFYLDKGVLNWTAVGSMTKYAIDVDAEATIIVDITDAGFSGTFDISTRKVTFELPSTINGYTIAGGMTHQVTMYIVGDDTSLLSSSLSDVIAEYKAEAIGQVSMQGGALVWSGELASQYSGFDVLLGFTFNDNYVEAVIPTTTNTMLLPDSIVIGSTEYQLGGNDYSVAVKRRGTRVLFNSDYSPALVFTRLNDVTDVHTENGQLHWASAEVSGYAPNYSLLYNTMNSQTNVNYESFDDYKNQSTSNTITVTIACLGDDIFMTGRRTSEYTLDILATPINVSTNKTQIIWDAVSGADAYQLEIRGVIYTIENGIETKSYGETTTDYSAVNSYALPDSGSNSNENKVYEVKVMAISRSADDNKINSRYSDTLTVNKPAIITSLTFNDTLKRWEWSEAEGIKTYYFNYTFNDSISKSVEITTNYFKPTELGTYSLVSVQAMSEGDGSILSNKAQWQVGSDLGVYVFDLFTSGVGSQDNPYIISNVAELFNIEYYADSHYKINGMLNFNDTGKTYRTYTTNGVETTYTIKDYLMAQGHMDSAGRIISGIDGFTGTLDGQNNVLLGATLASSANVRGLFTTTTNAMFSNIHIKGFTLAGGKPDNADNETLAGIIVGHAIGTTFDNIKIKLSTNDTYSNSKVQITVSENIGSRMYVGGLAGRMSGGELFNVDITLEVTNTISSTKNSLYFGGVAGEVLATNMTKVITTITDNSNVNSYYIYGGIVANQSAGTISQVKATVTMATGTKADVVGGVVGSTTGAISQAVSYGTLRARGLVNADVQRDGRVGGLVGKIGQGGSLENSYTQANIYLDASTASNAHMAYAGRIVGETNGYITNCWVAVSESAPVLEVTNPDSTTYGYAGVIVGTGNEVYIENCYQSADSNIVSEGRIIYLDYSAMIETAFVNTLNTLAG